jgi:antitoxin PrlF
MLTSRLTSKGQTTMPREVREKLRLRPGDTLVYAEEGGRIVLRRHAAEPDEPFASFSEWDSAEDRAAYGRL